MMSKTSCGRSMIYTYSINLAGPSHIEQGAPCQDSFFVKRNKQGIVIAAVADGLANGQHSEIGSYIAAYTASDYCADRIQKDMDPDAVQETLKESFRQADNAVKQKATADNLDPNQYETTLCLAVYDGKNVYYGQAGDSGILVLLENGEYRAVTDQQRDEEKRVFPLGWDTEKWEFGYVKEPVSAVLLMTDGVYELVCPLEAENERYIDAEVADRFIRSFDITEQELAGLQEASRSYLENPPVVLDDDKTLLVLINTDRKPMLCAEKNADGIVCR